MITALDQRDWSGGAASSAPGIAEALERGAVLFCRQLPFAVRPDEAPLFSPQILTSAKNASFDAVTGRIGGVTLEGADRERLRGLMQRFSEQSAALVDGLLPAYRGRILRARTSFRPAEIAGRPSSWRKDDTRLHVDAFPASPVQGRRILRVFSNVNPSGRPRSWRVGGEFGALVDRFAPALSLPWAGQGWVLRTFRITKSLRTPYDALMLQLHDRMKEDAAYQQGDPQTAVDFPAGTTWLTFTDSVSHAAMAGQYQLEQTFLLPVEAMLDENRSPLRILERRFGRRLA
ncbi:MAG: Kdo hydroxylase family protein [Vicinamibacterales bacterium]